MNYLLGKKNRRIFILIFFLLALAGLWSYAGGSLRHASSGLARPLWKTGKNIGSVWSGFIDGWRAKSALESENQMLKEEVAELELRLAGTAEIFEENAKLKEILGRAGGREVFLAAVLAKPNRSPYDTLIIDLGSRDGLVAGADVFAYGDVLIGKIMEVFPNSSKAGLFSTAGQKSDIVLAGQDVYLPAVGRGGGVFEISAPRDLEISEGAELLLPGLERRVLAVVTKIISDPRDPVQTVLATSPVNIQHLRWVEVEK